MLATVQSAAGAVFRVKEKDFCYREVVSSYLTLFFVTVLRNLKMDSPLIHSWQEQVVEDVQQYLATNLAAQVTLAEISNQVGLSPNYLCALFREQTGKTIFEHLGYLRLKKAQFLLRNTQLPIYSIAEQVATAASLLLANFSARLWEFLPLATVKAKRRL